jgi:hypothetical protein
MNMYRGVELKRFAVLTLALTGRIKWPVSRSGRFTLRKFVCILLKYLDELAMERVLVYSMEPDGYCDTY